MKHLFYLLPFALLLLAPGCSDDSSSLDPAWKSANDEAYRKITTTPGYGELKTPAGPSGIYYKVIKTGEGTEHPIQTSSVKALYYGAYYDGTVFDAGSYIFNDMRELVEPDPAVPKLLSTKGTIRGFSFALQNMAAGDKWDIWIPYWLGYGETGYINTSTGETLIKAYTTLHFVVELVEIIQYPE
ncbi:MAG: FKBP-type peptidyl-prolyl cis-trans isomerase [Candidatus Symbiothrix sp.]|jgi:peptidylprolyl isomerase/FKBP-type peptidyl-prolyl cis-trans isomerase FklB|nr:FKBP-type peptidyl-prolyl cis-trans isomerase [Candidatus Symbiothrix sp.]